MELDFLDRQQIGKIIWFKSHNFSIVKRSGYTAYGIKQSDATWMLFIQEIPERYQQLDPQGAERVLEQWWVD